MSPILSQNPLLKQIATHPENQQKEEASKTPKQLYFQEAIEMVNQAFRSKNLLSGSHPLPESPKETIIEVTFIKRIKN
jgi:hypothetical protein